jgi:hypothetical protein
MIKPVECIHGGLPEWSAIWEPAEGFEFVYLQCKKKRCEYGDWNCRSEYFSNDSRGREAAIIDWNRNMKRKEKESKK